MMFTFIDFYKTNLEVQGAGTGFWGIIC